MAKSTFLTPLLLVPAILAGCRLRTEAGPAPYDGAEAEVWAAAIREMEPPGALLVLRGTTRSELSEPDGTPRGPRELDGFPPALVDRLRAEPETSVPDDLDVGRRRVVVPAGELDAIWSGPVSSEEGWEEFRRRYPEAQGYVSLSRVAFSADGEQAAVTFAHTFASLGGRASLLLLRRTDDGWTIEDTRPLWIA